jgi:hypothetical protein
MSSTGLIGAAVCLLGLAGACSSEEERPTTEVDVAQINAGAAAVEQAFLSGDPAKVLAEMTDEAAEQYRDGMAEIKDKLGAFGEAFKTRTLVANGEHYAEYSYTAAGKKYTVAFARGEDGKPWKLVRF